MKVKLKSFLKKLKIRSSIITLVSVIATLFLGVILTISFIVKHGRKS